MEKVLLLNFTEKEAERLSEATGLEVHRGFLDTKPGVVAKGRSAAPQFYAPNSFYEYAAIFMNLDEDKAIKDEFSNRSRLWTERDMHNLVSFWRLKDGWLVAFIGNCGYDDLHIIGMPAKVTQAEDTDTACVFHRFSNYDGTDFRRSVAVLSKKVKMPASKYLHFSDAIVDKDEPCLREVFFNKNGDVIGAYMDNMHRYSDVDQPTCMLLPQFKNNIEVIEGLINEKAKISNLFHALRVNSWQEADNLLPTSVKAYEQQKGALAMKFDASLRALNAAQEAERQKYSHLTGLVANQGDELVADVEWALRDVLRLGVTNSDALMRSRVRKEDLVITLGMKTLLAEVKGTESQNPSPAYVSQLLTHAALNKKPDKVIDGCMLIVNYNLQQDPSKRPLAYSGELEGLLADITFLDTRVLHALILLVIEGDLTAEEAIGALDKLGRVQIPVKAKRDSK